MISKNLHCAILTTLCAFVAIGSAQETGPPDRSFAALSVRVRADTATSEGIVLPDTAQDGIPDSPIITVDYLTIPLDTASKGVSASAVSSPTPFPCINPHLPGMVLHPCVPKVTSLITSNHINVSAANTYQPANLTTITETQTRSVTKTITVTDYLSETNKGPTPTLTEKEPAMTTATGLCFWSAQAILTPCTGLVAATSVPSAALPMAHNPIKAVLDWIMYAKKSFAILALVGLGQNE